MEAFKAATAGPRRVKFGKRSSYPIPESRKEHRRIANRAEEWMLRRTKRIVRSQVWCEVSYDAQMKRNGDDVCSDALVWMSFIAACRGRYYNIGRTMIRRVTISIKEFDARCILASGSWLPPLRCGLDFTSEQPASYPANIRCGHAFIEE